MALQACRCATFSKETVPQRGKWEARRTIEAIADAEDEDATELLFQFRHKKLQSSILLDGYNLLTTACAKPDSGKLPETNLFTREERQLR